MNTQTPSEQSTSDVCPTCGAALIESTTRSGKRMKRCSTNKWDPETKTASGCTYVEWMKGNTEETDEDCPDCGKKLVIYTSAAGKRLKKCSTNTWDPKTKQALGCQYTQWL
jgi:ssDNA-binding Zn-finger/Zn-ribbon topoisomerase 1